MHTLCICRYVHVASTHLHLAFMLCGKHVTVCAILWLTLCTCLLSFQFVSWLQAYPNIVITFAPIGDLTQPLTQQGGTNHAYKDLQNCLASNNVNIDYVILQLYSSFNVASGLTAATNSLIAAQARKSMQVYILWAISQICPFPSHYMQKLSDSACKSWSYEVVILLFNAFTTNRAFLDNLFVLSTSPECNLHMNWDIANMFSWWHVHKHCNTMLDAHIMQGMPWLVATECIAKSCWTLVPLQCTFLVTQCSLVSCWHSCLAAVFAPVKVIAGLTKGMVYELEQSEISLNTIMTQLYQPMLSDGANGVIAGAAVFDADQSLVANLYSPAAFSLETALWGTPQGWQADQKDQDRNLTWPNLSLCDYRLLPVHIQSTLYWAQSGTTHESSGMYR